MSTNGHVKLQECGKITTVFNFQHRRIGERALQYLNHLFLNLSEEPLCFLDLSEELCLLELFREYCTVLYCNVSLIFGPDFGGGWSSVFTVKVFRAPALERL